MDGFLSGRMFCVVEFVGKIRRTVVPDTWLSVNDTLCLLPPDATDSDVDAMARNLAEPGEGWMMLEVRSVETFGSYSEAKEQLSTPKDTSHSQASSSLRKRKRPSYLEHFSSHDSDDDRKPYAVFETDFDGEDMSENEWIPPLKSTPRMGNSLTTRKTIHNDHRSRSCRFNQSGLLSEKENIDYSCDCQSSCHSSFIEALHSMQKQLNRTNQMVQKQNNQMMQQIKSTFEIVQQLLKGQKKTHSNFKRVLQPRPTNQMTSPEEMDSLSQDDTNSAQSVLQNQSTLETPMRTENPTTEAKDACISEEQPSSHEVSQNQSTLGARKRTENPTTETEDSRYITGDQSSTAKNQSTSRTQKEAENPTTEVQDTCITGDQPSTIQVPEREISKSLRNRIQSVLKEIKTEEMEKILRTFDALGVESMDDLKYVRTTDLRDVVSEVQSRTLVESFQTDSKIDVQNGSKLEFPRHSNSDCVVNISWNKMPAELLADLKSNNEPKPSRYREMVRIIADDIIACQPKRCKSFVKSVAESCVKEYPILKDKFEDQVIGTGVERLTRRLLSRIENEQRRHSKEKILKRSKNLNLTGSKNKKGGYRDYGCVAWAPRIVKGTSNVLERKKRSLLQLEASKHHEKIGILMEDTYCLQRNDINDGADIKTLLSEWPFLFEMQGMLSHFKILTGIDIRQQKKRIVNEKCKSILVFLHSIDKVKDFMTANENAPNKLVLLFTAIALYFDEDPTVCIRTCKVLNPHDDLQDIPCNPCLIGKGTSALKANEFMICVDKVAVNSEIKDADFAVIMLFASYYVLNMAYPKSIALTLEFFQRCLIGINPSTGSKVERIGKCLPLPPRLLALVNKLMHLENRPKEI